MIKMSFSAYKDMCEKQNLCKQKSASKFIWEGSAATKIKYKEHRNQPAALMLDTKEGPDQATVFTMRKAEQQDELLKGDYFSQMGKPDIYFVFEDVKLVRNEIYKKQLAYECNVVVNNYDLLFPAYFVSSLKRYLSVEFNKNIGLASIDKPIAIFPQRDDVEVGTTLIISDRGFTVTEIDDITNSQIMYCSLSRTFMDKAPKEADENESGNDVVVDDLVLYAGLESTVDTNDGYFTASEDVEIISRSGKTVRFVIPFDVYEIKVAVKDENGEIVETTYVVR